MVSTNAEGLLASFKANVNPAAQRLATAAAGSDARPGVTLWQTLPDLLGSDSETNLRRCMEQRTPVDFETIHEGRTLHFRLHPAPEGGMVIYAADLTARRRAESALRVKHEHLRLTQQAAKIGQWELNLRRDGKLVRLPACPPTCCACATATS